ncbi:MAG TPA: hypothetical protein VKB54_12020 [Solirubrobacteraceae bacterium]|nr:hypothetical protein [Solirubrobacteraceae bacterium]
MPVGLNAALTKQSIDVTLGEAAQAVNIAMLNAESAAAFLAPAQDADLIALGYSGGEVAVLRSAINDLDRLRRVYAGLEATAAYDFRTFAKQLYGTGYVPGR